MFGGDLNAAGQVQLLACMAIKHPNLAPMNLPLPVLQQTSFLFLTHKVTILGSHSRSQQQQQQWPKVHAIFGEHETLA
jgi:hypothetical protein